VKWKTLEGYSALFVHFGVGITIDYDATTDSDIK